MMGSDDDHADIPIPSRDGDNDNRSIQTPSKIMLESSSKSSSTLPLRRSLMSSTGDDHQDDTIDGTGGIRSHSSHGNSSSGRPSRTVRIISNRFALMSELSGACGDFGTLIPLLVAMARLRTIYLAPTLFLTGIVHIVTGWYWDLPMPLQPMKAIASLAIAQELTRPQVTTAGIGVGACFLMLSMGNFIEVVNRWIPQAVISGLQLGVGWKLALKGIHMIQDLPWGPSLGSVDCITLSVLCGALCLYGLRRNSSAAESHGNGVSLPRSTTSNIDNDEYENVDPHEGLQQNIVHDNHGRNEVIPQSLCQNILDKPPVGIVLFLLGIVLAAVQLQLGKLHDGDKDVPDNSSLSEPLLVNALQNVTAKDWWIGLLSGTLTQIPLSTLNSCLSVCLLAQSLFPGHEGRLVSRKSVCISMGLINCVLCPLGCMPSCHGAGGLAGQHRLGANTGLSMIVLGLFKISLSLLAVQGSLLHILDALPVSVLGVLLVLAGHELAATGVLKVAKATRTINESDDALVVCLITGLVIVGTGHAHIGTLCGWITCIMYGGGDELPWGDCHPWMFCSVRALRRRRSDANTTSGQSQNPRYSPLVQGAESHSEP